MKRRIVSLLLAVIMLFGLLPVTALAERRDADTWVDGIKKRNYTLFENRTDLNMTNQVNAGMLYHDMDIYLYEIKSDGSRGAYVDKDRSTSAIITSGGWYSMTSGQYWFWLEGKKNVGSTQKTSTAIALEIDKPTKDHYVNICRLPRAIPLNNTSYCTVTQKTGFSESKTLRTVNVYLDGKTPDCIVATATCYFPNSSKHNISTDDLSVSVNSRYKRSSDGWITASGNTYNIYLVTGPRKVIVNYRLTGKGNYTNGLQNSTIAGSIFHDTSLQNKNFTVTYTQDPGTKFTLDTALTANAKIDANGDGNTDSLSYDLVYHDAVLTRKSGDADSTVKDLIGKDKYEITVGKQESVFEVTYDAIFPHSDPLVIDSYKRGAGGIFDYLGDENRFFPYGFDLSNLHETEQFFVIKAGGLTPEAREKGIGADIKVGEQIYKFWKAGVGFDWDRLDRLYYMSSSQTWFYTYEIPLYYRDIFNHKWVEWASITVGPIEVPYGEGRINFVYQRYNPDTGEDNPEDTGDYSFTLAYDGNAGAEKIGVPQPTVMSNVALSDTGAYEIPVSRYQPERTDYKFLGWDENPNATTLAYPAGNLGPVIFNGSDGKTQTKTLYAIWQKDGGDSATYTATYYWNYDEKTDSYHTQENLKTGDKLTQPDDPTREGYTFGGWYTTDTCTDGTKWDFATNTVQKQDIYLYAKWTEAASTSYTINYYKDYQDGDQPFETTSGNGYVGDVINADVDNNKPDATYIVDTSRTTKTSMKLVEKLTDNDNVLNIYYEKDEHGNRNDGTDGPDGVPDKYQVKVTFKVDGGTWSNKTSDPIVKWLALKDGSGNWSVDGSASYTTPTGMICTTSFPGYFATGSWSTPAPNADGIYRKADDGKEFTYLWTQGDKDDSQWATVTYKIEGDNGRINDNQTTSFEVLKGAKWGEANITDPSTTADPGYAFDGWTGKAETIENDVTVTGTFSIDNSKWATVTYKIVGGNGSINEGQTTSFEVLKGTKWGEANITDPSTTADPGYAFDGWTGKAETIENDVTVTGTFSIDNSKWATVTYKIVGGNGSINEGQTTSFEVLKGTKWGEANITDPSTTADPGYAFDGWTGKAETIENDVTVTGTFSIDNSKWATVTYKIVGGNGSINEGQTTSFEVLKGTKWGEANITDPSTTADPGYAFDGWTGKAETIENDVTVTGTFSIDNSKWATVTYKIVGGNGSINEGQTASFTVLKGTKWSEAGITAPTTTAESGYRFAGWVGELAAEETIETSFTITGSFVINEAEWVTIQFAAGPNGSLIGDTSVTVLKNTLWSEITVPETKGDTGYTFLEWSPELPDSTDAITESATYTAYFTKRDGDWVSVDYVIVGGHGDFVSGAQTHFEILKDTLWGAAGISAPAVEAEYGYYFDGWTGELAADEAISENITVVGRFEQEFDIIPAIIEILKPRDMLTKEHIAYLNGYSDGTVRPNGNITRAEVATIFFRLLTDEVRDANLTYGNTFTDVPNGAWYNAAVSTLSSMQIINGYTDGSFRPNQNITRAELASIIARFAELKNTSGVYFTDIGGHWAADNICLAAANGWITGYADGSFKPNRPVTRAETVTMINRVLERSPLSTDDLLDGMVTYSDNLDTTAWYYLAIQEASNSHDYTRMTVGEFWRSLLPNRDWSRYQR